MRFSHNDAHVDLVIEELLPQARTFVAEGTTPAGRARGQSSWAGSRRWA
jgi:hypothetical protein